MSELTVQVGGHVTLLFSIHSKSLLARNQGSRGAGFCLEDGVEATARIIDEKSDRISVTAMDGTPFDEGKQLYTDLLDSFRELFKVDSAVEINIQLELPV